MEVKQFVNNPFQENCWIVTEDGEALLIDCGAFDAWEESNIARFIEKEGATVVGHLLTHGHLDHVFGCLFVQEKWGIKPTVNCKDESMLANIHEHCMMWGLPCKSVPAQVQTCIEGEMTVGHFRVNVLSTPGHTPGGVCYEMQESDGETTHLFTGDTLFDGGYGRTDLPGGNFDALMASLDRLETHIRKCDRKVVLYPGHGGYFVRNQH